jgi:putative nucleotidyltransferase with HDIG domain
MQRNIMKRKQNGATEPVIRALADLVGFRDGYLREHQERVAELAAAIATALSLPGAQVRTVYWAALIHDIGKFRIPFEILYKPGQLDEIEYRLIQTHAQTGYEIINACAFPEPVAPIVLQHHERWNGSGYPRGLRGEQILLEARILGVADVVEAMTCHRPYRPALGMEKALAEITLNRAVCYDPAVVDACLAVFREQGFHFDSHPAPRRALAGPSR